MKVKKKYIIAGIALLIALSIASFFIFEKSKNDLDVNVSDIEADIEIKRFDRDLFSDYKDIEQHINKLEKKYPKFFPLFTQQIIKIGHTGYKDFYEYLEAFMQDYAVENASKEVSRIFKDLTETEKTLTSGFKHYKYYYPDSLVPDFVSFIAGFNHSIVTTDSLIGIGLDKYLGQKHEFYGMMNIPSYAAKKMTREMIPFDAMKAWAKKDYPFRDTTNYLVYKMIYEGKILYYLDAMYPEMEDSLKIAYSEKEMAFCNKFEKDMWSHMVSEELLFNTDYLKQRKFVGEAPHTAEFGKKSPGRVGAWLGWQIVKAYVEKNNTSLPELMRENNYQKILNESEYQP